MSPLTRRVFGLLLHLLPAATRRHDGEELQRAFDACVARERARFGAAGPIYAWCRALADTLVAAVVIRLDDRRARRIAVLGHPTPSSGDNMLNRIWQDVRYAGRRVRKAPLVSATVILTLALATGATTAIFSVVDAVLLRGLPYPEADRLVMVYQAIPKAVARPIGFSAPDYLAFVQRATAFEAVAAFRNRQYELSGIEQPQRVVAALVSASLFPLLRVGPALGRGFTRDEDEGGKPVAVLSHALWRDQFASDPAVVGRAIVLDRNAYTVVGVMPPDFTFPNRGTLMNNVPAELYLPISFTERERAAFGSMYNNSVVARLEPGVTVQRADAEARTVVRAAAQELYPAALRGLAQELTASTIPLRDETVGRTQAILYVVFASVLVVLLIACADLANLMLTRAVARQREMAVCAGRGPRTADPAIADRVRRSRGDWRPGRSGRGPLGHRSARGHGARHAPAAE